MSGIETRNLYLSGKFAVISTYRRARCAYLFIMIVIQIYEGTRSVLYQKDENLTLKYIMRRISVSSSNFTFSKLSVT